MIDLLIKNVTAVTVDKDRRVIEGATIAITDDRITAIDPAFEMNGLVAKTVIDGKGMAAIPGLIDSHSHAGHGLVRSLGAGNVDDWFGVCEKLYAQDASIEFWRAEAQLAALERIKAGITTAVSLLGGGADIYRTDDPVYGDAHCDVTVDCGIRTILAVGPGRPPFPKRFRRLQNDIAEDIDITFAQQLAVSEDLITRRNAILSDRTGVCLIMPVYSQSDLDSENGGSTIAEMSEAVADLRSRTDVLFTQDGHRDGSIAVAEKLGLLGSYSLLAHCVDLTKQDIASLKKTGASVVHNPSSIMSILGRCPAPELIGDGVRVCLGSDGGAPDRGFDMFRHMSNCMHYHRRHFKDPSWMPPGKVFEMATIDAANALGLSADIGSLEIGKKADIVLVDLRKAHLYPANMPVTRLTHFANAADVDTVIVDGKILMRDREVFSLNEDSVLDSANSELTKALERTQLTHMTKEPDDWWQVNRIQYKPQNIN